MLCAAGGWHAAGSVGALALGSEVLQVVNTFFALLLLNKLTGASSFVSLVETFGAYFRHLGALAYPTYAALLLTITVLPLMSAIFFIVLAGTIFGPLRGTLLVSASLSTAAALSAALSRRACAARGLTLARLDARAAMVDASLAAQPARTSLFLFTLLRLSPVLPFTFSNYLAGLTSLPLWVVFVGTLIGTLPSQAVYVGAGALGQQALEGGVRLPKPVLALGALATVGVIVGVGHVAKSALAGMDLEAQAVAPSGRSIGKARSARKP